MSNKSALVRLYADRRAIDAESLLVMQRVREARGTTCAELEAVEAMEAAASILEHPNPTTDPALAIQLRAAVNLLLETSANYRDAVYHTNNAIRELGGTP